MPAPLADISGFLPASAPFEPTGKIGAFLKKLPARWVVCLLADEAQRPIQLLSVRNLRNCLKGRLGLDPAPEVAPLRTRRIDYRTLVRHIYWRRMDSSFEADWFYYEVARTVFPTTYRGMIALRAAWFVHVDPDADFPRYIKTDRLDQLRGVYLGPFEEKAIAAKAIQLAEDCFDLCRYHEVLVQAPRGRACAYKEMGKCPAPCDGSISLEQYRRLIAWSVDVLADPNDMIGQQTRRMEKAASELRFESAAKIKALLTAISQLGKGPFRHARRLQEFRFVSLQRGPRPGTAKVFLAVVGRIKWAASLIAEPNGDSALLGITLAGGEPTATAVGPLDTTDAERLGLVAHRLFSSKADEGIILRVAEFDDQFLRKAYRALLKQSSKKNAEGSDGVDDGILMELHPLTD